MIFIIIIPLVIVLILSIISKYADIIIGLILSVSGFSFKSYLQKPESLELKLKAYTNGIKNLDTYATILLGVGIAVIVVGILRFIFQKKKTTNINEKTI